jgi:sterol desaturase/sphingolipid hydroxylase (fatty acid hydroxylase superfamily)
MATDSIWINALKSSYPQDWSGLLHAPPLRQFAFFVVGAIVFYVLVERSVRRFTPAAIWKYIFPKSLYGHASARVDRWNFLLYLILWGPLSVAAGVIAGAAIGGDLNDWLISVFGGREPLLHSETMIVAVQALFLFVTWELTDFTMHFAWHRVPVLWSIHRAHHSTEALTFFATFRAHPVEFIAVRLQEMAHMGIFGGLMLFVMGRTMNAGTLAAYLAIKLIGGLGNVLAHAHIPVSFGRWNRIIGSSVLHQIHHSAELRHRDKNFGLNLMLFDWLFGTLYLPTAEERYRWGLNEEELGARNPHARLRDLYLEPLKTVAKVIQGARS